MDDLLQFAVDLLEVGALLTQFLNAAQRLLLRESDLLPLERELHVLELEVGEGPFGDVDVPFGPRLAFHVRERE